MRDSGATTVDGSAGTSPGEGNRLWSDVSLKRSLARKLGERARWTRMETDAKERR
jgi:hypothetical protein